MATDKPSTVKPASAPDPDAAGDLKFSGTLTGTGQPNEYTIFRSRTDERTVFLLGASIVIGAVLTMLVVVIACFIMIMSKIEINNQGMLAVCTGIIGSVLGNISAHSQQIISFYFGQKRQQSEK